MNRMRRGSVLIALLAAGCSDSSGPRAGDLVVSLAGAPQARAVSFRLVGARSLVGAPSGTSYLVYSSRLQSDTMDVIVVATQGATLATGPIARVAVPDVARVRAYSAVVVEVAGPTYALQDPSQFTLSVVRP
jgi:hypothetical protein